MPIRINLKELFPADAQEITVDKINFNFNKLLELGVGEAGPIGPSGIQGPAGPIGATGLQGIRGVTWLVDSGNPTAVDDLLDGDLYLDSTSLAVWQWNAETNDWVFLFDITAIIQNYLNSLNTSTFVRGFGTGSPNDDRYILFNNRGDTGDTTNDILFLSNYDETQITNSPSLTGSPDTDDFYEALLTISVDKTNPLINIPRSHLELGVLHGIPLVSTTITEPKENLKLRYDRLDFGSVHSGIDHFNLATFSLDILNKLTTADRDFSAVFAFESPKYLPTVPVINQYTTMAVGSRYGLDEIAPSANSGDTLADGIVFFTGNNGGNIGVATDYLVFDPSSAKNTGYIDETGSPTYFMLDPIASTESIFLRGKVYQNEGNIIQLGTGEANLTGSTPVLTNNAALLTPRNYAIAALAHQGNLIFSVFGKDGITTLASPWATYNEVTIENPNFPVRHISNLYPTFGSPASDPNFLGISDLVAAGDYLYCITCLSSAATGPSAQIAFQTIKTREEGGNTLPYKIGSLTFSSTSDALNCAHRIKLRGNLAVITTNALPISPSVTNLGGVGYDGKVVLVDVTRPEDPFIVGSAVTTKTTSELDAADRTAALMDMDMVDDIVYTLTWEQNTLNSSKKLRIKVDAFNIEGQDKVPTTPIQWEADTSGITNGYFLDATVNASDYTNNLSKVGAICANKRYVYAAYSVYSAGTGQYTAQLKIFELDGSTISVPPSSFGFKWLSNLSLTVSGTQIKDINKIQQVGNSLYVLVNTVADLSHLIKVDVSVPTAPFQVKETQISASTSEYYNTFLIKGKHIYFANPYSQGSTSSDFKAFEIDGIYSGSAHLESLRADLVDVTQEMNIGGDLLVNNELIVGGRARITGGLGVGGPVRIVTTGNTTVFLENMGGSSQNSIEFYHGKSAGTSTNRIFRLRSYPTHGELAANSGKALYMTTDGASNNMRATGADVNIFTQNSGDVNITAQDAVDIVATTADVNITSSANDVNITANDNVDIVATTADVNITSSANDVNITATEFITATGKVQMISNSTAPNLNCFAGADCPPAGGVYYFPNTGPWPVFLNSWTRIIQAVDYDRIITAYAAISGGGNDYTYAAFEFAVSPNIVTPSGPQLGMTAFHKYDVLPFPKYANCTIPIPSSTTPANQNALWMRLVDANNADGDGNWNQMFLVFREYKLGR